MQMGRHLLDAVDGFLLSKTDLILDRDLVFTSQFRRSLGEQRRDARALACEESAFDAYAERFVGSVVPRFSCPSEQTSLRQGATQDGASAAEYGAPGCVSSRARA